MEAQPISSDSNIGGNIRLGPNANYIGPINDWPLEGYRVNEDGVSLSPNSSELRAKGDGSDDSYDDGMEIDRWLADECLVRSC